MACSEESGALGAAPRRSPDAVDRTPTRTRGVVCSCSDQLEAGTGPPCTPPGPALASGLTVRRGILRIFSAEKFSSALLLWLRPVTLWLRLLEVLRSALRSLGTLRSLILDFTSGRSTPRLNMHAWCRLLALRGCQRGNHGGSFLSGAHEPWDLLLPAPGSIYHKDMYICYILSGPHTERHRETQRYTERHRETHRDTERDRETPRDT